MYIYIYVYIYVRVYIYIYVVVANGSPTPHSACSTQSKLSDVKIQGTSYTSKGTNFVRMQGSPQDNRV